jgi:hypothetical protein
MVHEASEGTSRGFGMPVVLPNTVGSAKRFNAVATFYGSTTCHKISPSPN